MDNTSIITQVANPKDEESISSSQDKGKEMAHAAHCFIVFCFFFLIIPACVIFFIVVILRTAFIYVAGLSSLQRTEDTALRTATSENVSV